MFQITANQVVRLSRGDDISIPLFINSGTEISPIRYSFTNPYTNVNVIKGSFEVMVDSDIFNVYATYKGIYVFHYINNAWIFEDEEIDNMESIGITINGDVQDGDSFEIDLNPIQEIYFYLMKPNCTFDNSVLKKTFRTNGEIITYKNSEETISYRNENVNENGDMVIRLLSEDTYDLFPGEYFYMFRAKVISYSDDSIIYNTITNKYPFYLIEDDFSDRSWQYSV